MEIKKRIHPFWPAVFALSLGAWLLLIAWIALAAQDGRTPLAYLRALRSPAGAQGGTPIPHDYYRAHGYPVESVSPAGNSLGAVNQARGQIRVAFSVDMDRGYPDILETWSVNSGDSLAPLEFRNWDWPDRRSFRLALNRDLGPGESLRLGFRFRRTDGTFLRPLIIEYR